MKVAVWGALYEDALVGLRARAEVRVGKPRGGEAIVFLAVQLIDRRADRANPRGRRQDCRRRRRWRAARVRTPRSAKRPAWPRAGAGRRAPARRFGGFFTHPHGGALRDRAFALIAESFPRCPHDSPHVLEPHRDRASAWSSRSPPSAPLRGPSIPCACVRAATSSSYVKDGLAAHTGIAANLDTTFLQRLAERLARDVATGAHLLDARRIEGYLCAQRPGVPRHRARRGARIYHHATGGRSASSRGRPVAIDRRRSAAEWPLPPLRRIRRLAPELLQAFRCSPCARPSRCAGLHRGGNARFFRRLRRRRPHAARHRRRARFAVGDVGRLLERAPRSPGRRCTSASLQHRARLPPAAGGAGPHHRGPPLRSTPAANSGRTVDRRAAQAAAARRPPGRLPSVRATPASPRCADPYGLESERETLRAAGPPRSRDTAR